MTNQQQTDLQLWKQDQSQPLPKSLDNVLIERCIKEFNNNEKVRIAFKYYEFGYTLGKMNIFPSGGKEIKLTAMLFFLSCTPDGQAVMPFLDVESKEYKEAKANKETVIVNAHGYDYCDAVGLDKDTPYDCCPELIIKKLDHLLFNSFVEALRTGKTFDEALKIINLIYLQKNF
jgi:hypothetical protein